MPLFILACLFLFSRLRLTLYHSVHSMSVSCSITSSFRLPSPCIPFHSLVLVHSRSMSCLCYSLCMYVSVLVYTYVYIIIVLRVRQPAFLSLLLLSRPSCPCSLCLGLSGWLPVTYFLSPAPSSLFAFSS